MERKMLRGFALLSVLAVAGLVVVHYYWFKKAFDIEEADFKERTFLALYSVNDRLHQLQGRQISPANRVEQISDSYYKVMVNDVIEPASLEAFLQQEFLRYRITQDFEYGIYDCLTESVHYCEYICLDGDCESSVQEHAAFDFPDLPEDNYYFGIYFPSKTISALSGMKIWLFSSAAILIVILFFAYSLFFIFRQKKLSEIQRDFVNNLTHEFKTPLSAISMSAEVLAGKNELSTSRKESYTAIIRQESQRLQQQVERILQLATPETKHHIQLEPLGLRNLIDPFLSQWSIKAQNENMTFEVNLKDENAILLADRDHLANVLHNLFDNALKYAGEHATIRLSTFQKGKSFCIEWWDSGKTFSKEEQKRLFDRFYRGKHPSPTQKGFGLGLYYVKNVIQAMKGKVTVENRTNGKAFVLSLRMVKWTENA